MDWLTQFLQNPAGVPGFQQPVGGEAVPQMPIPTGPAPNEYNVGPQPQSLGAALVGPEQAQAQAAPQAGGFDASKLTKALSGVQAPKSPDVVKPSTPAAPQMRAIQSGELLALLQSLGAGRAQAAARPVTLGGTLGIGRY